MTLNVFNLQKCDIFLDNDRCFLQGACACSSSGTSPIGASQCQFWLHKIFKKLLFYPKKT